MSLAPPHLPSPAPTPDHNPGMTPNGNGVVAPEGLAGSSTAAAAEAEQARLRADVESQLLRLSQDLYEMEVCAGDVAEGREDAVPVYLSRISAGFAQLSALSAGMTDSVPRQVVENVDHYRNPHLYTKNTVSRATGENQYALGRILGIEAFRRQLHDALSTDFPQIPLPERRHQPHPPMPPTAAEDSQPQLEGSGERVHPVSNGMPQAVTAGAAEGDQGTIAQANGNT